MKTAQQLSRFTAIKGANIALIKYMGKGKNNTSLNPTCSLYLPNCHTTVSMHWSAINTIDKFVYNTQITQPQQERFLQHIQVIRNYYNCKQGGFIVETKNNFPMGTGIASSASSFAALTQAVCDAVEKITRIAPISNPQKASLSRLGSGSSCRSFFQPWSVWEGEQADQIDLPYTDIIHIVVVTSTAAKEVSSSQAHKRVVTSRHFHDHIAASKERYTTLIKAMHAQNWQKMYQVVNTEWKSMHQLFSSCLQPFTYISAETETIISHVETCWQSSADGPLITLDAGPNAHILFRSDQIKLIHEFIEKFSNRFRIISGTHNLENL